MKIKYSGPSDFVNVEPFGRHTKGAVKEYPDEFGTELLATSTKQQFELVADGIAECTVAELKAMLDDKGIDYPKDAKKAELIELARTLKGED